MFPLKYILTYYNKTHYIVGFSDNTYRIILINEDIVGQYFFMHEYHGNTSMVIREAFKNLILKKGIIQCAEDAGALCRVVNAYMQKQKTKEE